MSFIGEICVGTESQGTRPSERLAMYLRGQYRRDHRIKRLATDINCTPKAAENILGGHWPSDLHLSAIVRRFGQDVLNAVFAPDIDATIAELTAEARALEEQLQDINARQRRLKGYSDQLSLFPDAPADLDREQTRLTERGGR